MESNIKIKATVPEMKEFFEKDGGVRYMEIQDKRYSEAALNAMPEEQYNCEKFTFAVRYRHTELDKPLTGTFSIPGLLKKLDELRETEKHIRIPVYKDSAEYAREHEELPLYRKSNRANMGCKKAIEDAIHANYKDNILNCKEVTRQISDEFGIERMVYVLANTVREKDHDGRISQANKEWAKTIPVSQEQDAWGQSRNCYFVVDQAHTGLVDLLVTHVRKELAKEKDSPDKRPSILEKLQKNTASVQAKTPVKKFKEQEL